MDLATTRGVGLMSLLPIAVGQKLAACHNFTTRDLDDARSHIGSMFKPHDLSVLGANQSLDVCIGRATVGAVSLVYHRHGAHVAVRPEKLDDFFLLQIPMRGEARVWVDNREVTCNPAQAVMISPSLGVEMEFKQGCEQLILRIDRPNLESFLEQQLQRPLGAPLEFAPLVRLDSHSGREILQLLEYMALSLSNDEGACRSPMVRDHMISLLLGTLVTSLEHNYNDELLTGISCPKPFYIKKAQRFIEDHARESITPESVALAVGVSPRALYAGFKRYLEISPMKYLREVRLDKVHRTLAQLAPEQGSVTSIALDYGFQHFGHFSSAYKAKFGQLPSDTLRQDKS